MKTIQTLILALLLAFTATLKAQTTNFIGSVETYLTTINTNFNFSSNKLELATGYKQVTGVGATSIADGSYNLNKSFAMGAVFQFSGVGSPINAVEGTIGYNLIQHYDTELTVELRGGYDWNIHSPEAEPAIFIKKKMTTNTFTKLGLSLPFYLKQKFSRTPSVIAEAGFTY